MGLEQQKEDGEDRIVKVRLYYELVVIVPQNKLKLGLVPFPSFGPDVNPNFQSQVPGLPFRLSAVQVQVQEGSRVPSNGAWRFQPARNLQLISTPQSRWMCCIAWDPGDGVSWLLISNPHGVQVFCSELGRMQVSKLLRGIGRGWCQGRCAHTATRAAVRPPIHTQAVDFPTFRYPKHVI